MVGAPLEVGRIVFVDIPDAGTHPAVVVLALADGYILVNGTGTPEAESPSVVLSAAVAKRCKLTKETLFYNSPKFVWYWRPDPNWEAPPLSLNSFPSYVAALTAVAVAVLRSLPRPQDVQRLRAEAGLTFADLKQLKLVL